MSHWTEESLDWIWDHERQRPHVRHWPAVRTGAVHIHDVSDLSALREAAQGAEDMDDWAERIDHAMPAERYNVAVDTLGDMLDHNRADCLGTATNLKGHSSALFALARGEILHTLPLAARIALLEDGLATIETAVYDQDTKRSELEALTVADLKLLARQSVHIPQRLRKNELIDALLDAEDRGEVELPLGDIAPAPPLHGWLETRVQQYVMALHVALGDPVYPLAYREAVWHKAIEQSSIPALKRALELEYWEVLEAEVDDIDPDSEDANEAVGTHQPETRAGDWQPGTSEPGRDRSIAWLAVGLLFVAWLFL